MSRLPGTRHESSASVLQNAVARALAFLADCQLPCGAVNDPVADPLAALAARRPSRRQAFRLRNGADIWHTTQAVLAFRAAGNPNRAAEAFVRSKLTGRGELSYWSAHPSLCIETCSAAFQALPRLRGILRKTLVRHALPGGRWPNFLLPGKGGYDAYGTGPSVTAWALSALGADHPLAAAGRDYLERTRAGDGLWAPHPAFYATPFYPAHLAVGLVRDRGPVALATMRWQLASGGWGFEQGESSRPSVLPSALALSTLVASGRRTPACRRALDRGSRWLLSAQDTHGAFPLGRAPSVLFYAGDVYATCVSVLALLRAREALA